MSEDDYPVAQPVVLQYNDVIDPNKDLNKEIEEAYGYGGIGLLVVDNVPGLGPMRERLLPLGHKFARLPEEVQEQYADKESHYSFGWSKGKEKLRKGRFDTFKGSFYNNPQVDRPTEDPQEMAEAPDMLRPNIWPTKEVPDLEPAFKDLGQLIVNVGKHLAHHVDKYVQSVLGDKYPVGILENIVTTSNCAKGRLLVYYPIMDDSKREIDSWCGWHNDHSALTGLCPNMFMNFETGAPIPNPDPNSGLYAKKRDGSIVKVRLPVTGVGFQIGETTQVFTGAVVRATPHAVRAVKYPESQFVCRSTIAVFMQPGHKFILKPPEGIEANKVAVGQFKGETTFGNFSKETVQFYYGADGGY